MTKLIQTLKGYQQVKDLVEGELSNYSYFKSEELKWNDNYGEYEEDDEQEHYAINIKFNDKNKTLYFNYNIKEDAIEIELSEDCWEEVTTYDYKIKYFWMTLL